MRYRIADARSDARRALQRPSVAPAPPKTRIRFSAGQPDRRAGPFKPVAWPVTGFEAGWTSVPVFGRSPAGWYRIGFHT